MRGREDRTRFNPDEGKRPRHGTATGRSRHGAESESWRERLGHDDSEDEGDWSSGSVGQMGAGMAMAGGMPFMAGGGGDSGTVEADAAAGLGGTIASGETTASADYSDVAVADAVDTGATDGGGASDTAEPVSDVGDAGSSSASDADGGYPAGAADSTGNAAPSDVSSGAPVEQQDAYPSGSADEMNPANEVPASGEGDSGLVAQGANEAPKDSPSPSSAGVAQASGQHDHEVAGGGVQSNQDLGSAVAPSTERVGSNSRPGVGPSAAGVSQGGTASHGATATAAAATAATAATHGATAATATYGTTSAVTNGSAYRRLRNQNDLYRELRQSGYSREDAALLSEILADGTLTSEEADIIKGRFGLGDEAFVPPSEEGGKTSDGVQPEGGDEPSEHVDTANDDRSQDGSPQDGSPQDDDTQANDSVTGPDSDEGTTPDSDAPADVSDGSTTDSDSDSKPDSESAESDGDTPADSDASDTPGEEPDSEGADYTGKKDDTTTHVHMDEDGSVIIEKDDGSTKTIVEIDEDGNVDYRREPSSRGSGGSDEPSGVDQGSPDFPAVVPAVPIVPGSTDGTGEDQPTSEVTDATGTNPGGNGSGGPYSGSDTPTPGGPGGGDGEKQNPTDNTDKDKDGDQDNDQQKHREHDPYTHNPGGKSDHYFDSLDTKSFAQAETDAQKIAQQVNTLKDRVLLTTANVGIGWLGKGHSEYDTLAKTIEMQIKDISKEFIEFAEALIEAETKYIEGDREAATRINSIANGEE